MTACAVTLRDGYHDPAFALFELPSVRVGAPGFVSLHTYDTPD